jgi:hypothetical protein
LYLHSFYSLDELNCKAFCITGKLIWSKWIYVTV